MKDFSIPTYSVKSSDSLIYLSFVDIFCPFKPLDLVIRFDTVVNDISTRSVGKKKIGFVVCSEQLTVVFVSLNPYLLTAFLSGHRQVNSKDGAMGFTFDDPMSSNSQHDTIGNRES